MDILTLTIGEHTYEVGLLPLSKGRPLLVLLTRHLGPAFGELLKESGGNVDEARLTSLVGTLIQDVSRTLSDEDLRAMIETLASVTKVSSGSGPKVLLPNVMETHFAGKFGELVRWLGFAIEVNFQSFFAVFQTAEPPKVRAKGSRSRKA